MLSRSGLLLLLSASVQISFTYLLDCYSGSGPSDGEWYLDYKRCDAGVDYCTIYDNGTTRTYSCGVPEEAANLTCECEGYNDIRSNTTNRFLYCCADDYCQPRSDVGLKDFDHYCNNIYHIDCYIGRNKGKGTKNLTKTACYPSLPYDGWCWMGADESGKYNYDCVNHATCPCHGWVRTANGTTEYCCQKNYCNQSPPTFDGHYCNVADTTTAPTQSTTLTTAIVTTTTTSSTTTSPSTTTAVISSSTTSTPQPIISTTAQNLSVPTSSAATRPIPTVPAWVPPVTFPNMSTRQPKVVTSSAEPTTPFNFQCYYGMGVSGESGIVPPTTTVLCPSRWCTLYKPSVDEQSAVAVFDCAKAGQCNQKGWQSNSTPTPPVYCCKTDKCNGVDPNNGSPTVSNYVIVSLILILLVS